MPVNNCNETISLQFAQKKINIAKKINGKPDSWPLLIQFRASNNAQISTDKNSQKR